MTMSKQDLSREEWEEKTKELRQEFERRLRDMDRQLRKSLSTEQEEIDEEGMNISALKNNLGVVRGRVVKAVKRGDDMVSDHPLLVVGGALAIGVLIGALAASRGKED